MTTDGGGWTLIGLIHYANQNNVDEPQDWFQSGNGNLGLLASNQFGLNQPPSAFGASLFSSLISSGSLARLEAVSYTHLTLPTNREV